MALILGIESSCDETGLAVYDSTAKRIIAESLFSQIDLHQPYGGVMPELASRHHLRRIIPLLEDCLSQAELQIGDIDLFSYTAGPGLNGALLVGTVIANTLAYMVNKPVVPIHHLEGHLLAPLLDLPQELSYPFLVLLVSGGHTQLILVRAFGRYQIVGDTLDDAAGEAFDKTAKMLGFPYPGGAHLARCAVKGRARYSLPRPMLNSDSLDMSFSGLKTACALLIKSICSDCNCNADNLPSEIVQDLAYAVEEAITDTLVYKSAKALQQYQISTLIISGGVSANQKLRQKFTRIADSDKVKILYPPLQLCTDNGAMIALAGAYRQQYAHHSYNCATYPRWNLEDLANFYNNLNQCGTVSNFM